ncbi:MAG: dual specificity protein phosphatase family protein, partial [Candidatus Thorarchaeota archaeon]
IDKFATTLVHEVITISDGDPFDSKDLDRGFSFIDESRNYRLNILVHCMAGVSRSPSLLAGYFMKIYSWNPLETLRFLVDKRHVIDPAPVTFNSVIQYVFGSNKQFICEKCHKEWIYKERFDQTHPKSNFFNYCNCFNPQIA